MHIVICMDYGNAKSICTYYGDSECVNAFQKGFTKDNQRMLWKNLMPYMKIEDISDNSVSIMSSMVWVSKAE